MKQIIRQISRIPRTAIAIVILCLATKQVPSQTKTGYAPVNGLKLYYEISGSGKPIVLLHGAFMTIGLNYGMLIPELSKTRQVIAVELQGHGHTADIDRPFSFESMADDVAALLKQLKTDSVDVIGYSMGGDVSLALAIRHPELVRKIVFISSVFKYEGWSAETRAIFPMIAPEFFEGTPLKKQYDSVAPNPKNWAQLVNKVKKLITTPYDYTAQVKTLKTPMFLIMGDADGIQPEHIAEMYRIVGGGANGDLGPHPKAQLAILPNTSHTMLFTHPDWLLSMITPFLN